MPKVAVHHHPCSTCGTKTECPGTWEENYDGEPAVICREYHHAGGFVNSDFLCETCLDLTEAEQEAILERRIAERAALNARRRAVLLGDDEDERRLRAVS